VQTLDDVITYLSSTPRTRALTIERADLPPEPGLYLWFKNDRDQPSYLGKATGRKGIRSRIWSQHLNPNYLETRQERWTKEDLPQAGCSVTKQGRPAIEKSAFRKALARKYGLVPGTPVVEFIRERYELIWIPLPELDGSATREIEYGLIRKLIPILNRSGNPGRIR